MVFRIMSACCRASTLLFLLLSCFLHVQGQVFQAPRAHDMFLRSKRANMYLVEEILQGNLERECYEETCNYEEAREYFEDTEKTIAFWTVYYDGDQCEPNPCLNGGNCTDKVGGFQCFCSAPHYGQICELGTPKDDRQTPSFSQTIRREVSECPTEGPTACHQLCMASYHHFTCSCMPGFKLHTDGRSCLPEVGYPCGRLPDSRNTTPLCRDGKCPWQVSLLNSVGVELCGGVVLGRFSVLTSARCLFTGPGLDQKPSSFYVVTGDNMLFRVKAFYIHERFRTDHPDNDLSLLELASPLPFGPTLFHLCLPTKDFCENILMHSGKVGVTKRRGYGGTHKLAYMTLDECRGQLNVSHPLSNKMFCMRRHSQPGGSRNVAPERLRGPVVNDNGTTNATESGTGSVQPSSGVGPRSVAGSRPCGGPLPGTPMATLNHGTAFLTGLLMSSTADCDGGGEVFTKVSRYLRWIKPRLTAAEDHMTPQERQYPEHR
ncbi:protein Z, vitamin K-dependent plasma glycoprotein b [Antennarius striatus]|uniref:protein Z, vitamin K-dependent plasma glycoprotein b n=1 Tax=Antennarius striatus TaxID=241820 RepID=UPI0035B43449